jgi:hypothetical protein
MVANIQAAHRQTNSNGILPVELLVAPTMLHVRFTI